MKRHAFHPVLVSTGSCLVGLGIGVGTQLILSLNSEREVRRMTEEFESRGWSSHPVAVAPMLRPAALPMLFTLLFGFLGIVAYLLYYWFVSRRSDEA